MELYERFLCSLERALFALLNLQASSFPGDGTDNGPPFGQTVEDFDAGDRQALINLGSRNVGLARQPGLMQVTLSYDYPQLLEPQTTGEYLVAAEVSFTTGKAIHKAIVDVPAKGCTFTVAGADGLEVAAFVDDDEATTPDTGTSVAVRASANFVKGGCGCVPAQRTRRRTLPADNDVLLPIPAFASRVSVVTDTLIGGAGPELRLFADTAGPLLVTTFSLFGFPAGTFSIPNGAQWFSISEAAPAARTYRVIFYLDL